MQVFLATSLARVAEALSKVLCERDTTLYWPAGGLNGTALSHGWQKPLFQRTTDQLACAGFDATTQIAVSVFIDRFLPRFIEHCATIPPGPADTDAAD